MRDKLEQAKTVFEALKNERKSLVLASVDASGRADASTVPFVYDEQFNFILLISGLAQHTQNLREQTQASIMLLEDEAGSDNLFARKRIQMRCHATQVSDADREGLLQLFRERHGKITDLLASLPDFVLVKLKPLEGQFVMGFGQAYRLSGELLDQFELIRPASEGKST